MSVMGRDKINDQVIDQWGEDCFLMGSHSLGCTKSALVC